MKTISDYIKEGWVAILKTGTHTDRKRRTHQFDEDRLQQIENNYKSQVNFSLAPLTVTHDSGGIIDLGKIEKVKKVGQYLFAKPKKVATEMIKALKRAGCKFISSSLNPDNTLNHVALVPNPAVPGLGEFPEAAMNFSQPEDSIELLIEFSALEGEFREELLAEWASSLRPKLEYIDDLGDTNQENIKDKDDQKEEKIMFTKKKKPDDDQPKEQEIETADDSPGENDEKEKIDFAAALEQANKRVEKAEQKADALATEVNNMKKESQEKEVAEFCNSLKPGAILPKFRLGVEKLLNLLTGEEETYDFSTAGDSGAAAKQTAYDFAKEFLSSLSPQIPLDPLKLKGTAGDDDEIEFADADDEEIELHRKAKAIMEEDKCAYEEALEKAGRR